MKRLLVIGTAATGVALLTTLSLAAGVGISATAAPVAFELEFLATHVPTNLPNFPQGFRHEGPFTASAPFCPKGTGVDLTLNGAGGDRLFTCDDGSGTATMHLNGFEHGVPGVWTIFEGTGRYATLRGQGTSTSKFPLEPPLDSSTNYRGVIDFDDVGPTISISTVKVQKPVRPKRLRILKVVFSAPDNVAGNDVSYRVTAQSGGSSLGSKVGQTSGTPVSVTLRIRPPKAARTLRVGITASDQVQNEAKPVFRTVKIPR